MIKKISNTKYEISCSGNCCPVVEYTNGMILISDDFGNFIKVSPDQAKFLSEAAEKCQK